MTTTENLEQTKENIVQTLFMLMKSKNYEDIKITEIASKSGYGRATVYRHFPSKEDMIYYYFGKHTTQFEDIKTMKVENEDDYYEIIFRVFSALKSAKDVIKLLMKARLEFLYLKFLNEAMAENFKLNNYSDTKYSPYYFAGSLYNVSMEWIKNDCDESVRHLSELYIGHLFTSLTERNKSQDKTDK